MPTAIPVTATSMNYASAVFAGFASVSIVWYVISGRRNFNGPPVPADVEPEQDGQVVGEHGGLGRVVTHPESEKTLDGSAGGKQEHSAPKM